MSDDAMVPLAGCLGQTVVTFVLLGISVVAITQGP